MEMSSVLCATGILEYSFNQAVEIVIVLTESRKNAKKKRTRIRIMKIDVLWVQKKIVVGSDETKILYLKKRCQFWDK